MASMSARTIHAIADELKVDPELIGSLILEHKLRSKDAVRKAVADYLAGASNGASSTPETESTPRKKKPGLTLSQRRALLRLLDADIDGVSPATAFKSLPYEHLERVGLAERQVDGEGDDAVTRFVLTDEGHERAVSINPGYRVWSSGETVVLDDEGNPVIKDPETGEPIRPPAGTTRAQRAAQAKAKAEADAAAAAAKAQADAEKESDEKKDVVPA